MVVGKARNVLEESLQIARRGDLKLVALYALANLGNIAREQGELAASRTLLREGLSLYGSVPEKLMGAKYVLEFALLEMAEGNDPQVALLFAAGETRLASIGYRMPSTERAQYDRKQAALRMRMAPTDFEASWARGRALTLPEAVACTLRQREDEIPA